MLRKLLNVIAVILGSAISAIIASFALMLVADAAEDAVRMLLNATSGASQLVSMLSWALGGAIVAGLIVPAAAASQLGWRHRISRTRLIAGGVIALLTQCAISVACAHAVAGRAGSDDLTDPRLINLWLITTIAAPVIIGLLTAMPPRTVKPA